MASKPEFSAQVIIQCDTCDTGNKIKWKCLTCGEVMCDSCKEFHIRTKALKDHKVVNAKEIEKYAGQERMKQAPKTKCQEHKEEYIHMFCKKCDIFVCLTCIAKIHAGHTFAKVEDIYLEKKRELQSYLSSSESKLAGYEAMLKSCDFKKAEVSKQRKHDSGRVKERYRTFQTYLDKAMAQMEAQLQESEFNDHKRLDDVRKEVITASKSVREFNQTCNQKLSASPAEMLSYLKVAKLNHVQQQQFKIPQLSGAVFKPGNTTAEEVASHLGSIDVGTMQAVADFKVTVQTCFKTKDSANRIIANKDDNLWIGFYKSNIISLVNTKGKTIKSVDICDPLYDFTLSAKDDLLISHYHGYKVKQMLGNQDKLVDFYDASPFYTYGITCFRSGDILVGIFDYEGSREGKIIRLSPTGRILQIVYGLRENKEIIFECPIDIAEFQSGHLYVVSTNKSFEKTIIRVDWSGKLLGTVSLANERQDIESVNVDKYGNILVVYWKEKIQLLDSEGKYIRNVLDKGDSITPDALCFDRLGYLWVTDHDAKTVYKMKYIDC